MHTQKSIRVIAGTRCGPVFRLGLDFLDANLSSSAVVMLSPHLLRECSSWVVIDGDRLSSCPSFSTT